MALFTWWKKSKKGGTASVTTSVKTKGSSKSRSKRKVVETKKLLHEHHKAFIEKFVTCSNNHDFVSLRKHVKSGARVHFIKAEADMTFEEYADEVDKVNAAFPDFKMTMVGEPESVSDDKVKILVIVSGTHTGKPYGFGPYPEMEAKGIKTKNDPEYVTFKVEGDSMAAMFVEATGPKTGPPGLYTQIGGLVF